MTDATDPNYDDRSFAQRSAQYAMDNPASAQVFALLALNETLGRLADALDER